MAFLLTLEGLLWLSGWFRWLSKGYPVLLAAAGVGVAGLLLILWFLLALVFHLGFQFSIRALLILAVVVAVPCSWLSWEIRKAKEQRALIIALHLDGGSITYDDPLIQLPSSRLVGPFPTWQRILLGDDFFNDVVEAHVYSDAQVASVSKLRHLHNLVLSSPGITDRALGFLGGLRELHELSLVATQIGDKALIGIGTLPHLRHLHISTYGYGPIYGPPMPVTQSTNIHIPTISDACLPYLSALSELQHLSLVGTSITDAGMPTLATMRQLTELELAGNFEVTDAAIPQLQKLTQLTSLSLSYTKITSDGEKTLRQALPNCEMRIYMSIPAEQEFNKSEGWTTPPAI